MTPTPQQAAFISALVSTSDNIALVARAGTGKTSTILMGVDEYLRTFPSAELTVCAFNKPIAEEVGDKLKERGHDWKKAQAATIHSMGFSLLKYQYRPTVDNNKVKTIIRAQHGEIFRQYEAQIAELVRYAKGAGLGFFQDRPIKSIPAWLELGEHYDVGGFEDVADMEPIIREAMKVYDISLAQTHVVDFDDMILFPLIKRLRVRFPRDLIFVDEYQDTSRARQALVRKFVRPEGGRICVVGDDRQAIYGFAGADAQAMENGIKSLNAKVMPLTVTWRCPRSVVQVAQRYVPDIVSPEGAREGFVGDIAKVPDALEPTDAILCRKTAPLIKLAYSLLRKGQACKVEGRAIGDGLIALANRWKVTTIDALIMRVEEYKERELKKAREADNEAKAEQITDKTETLLQICGALLAQNKKNVSDVAEFIRNLFADDVKGVTTLATYHRSKGREWPRVFLLDHAVHSPSRAARQDWQLRQEANLAYVAVTRAKETLLYLNTGT